MKIGLQRIQKTTILRLKDQNIKFTGSNYNFEFSKIMLLKYQEIQKTNVWVKNSKKEML